MDLNLFAILLLTATPIGLAIIFGRVFFQSSMLAPHWVNVAKVSGLCAVIPASLFPAGTSFDGIPFELQNSASHFWARRIGIFGAVLVGLGGFICGPIVSFAAIKAKRDHEASPEVFE